LPPRPLPRRRRRAQGQEGDWKRGGGGCFKGETPARRLAGERGTHYFALRKSYPPIGAGWLARTKAGEGVEGDKKCIMEENESALSPFRPMSVAGGGYGGVTATSGGGFVRVNGNPMDMDGVMNGVVKPSSSLGGIPAAVSASASMGPAAPAMPSTSPYPGPPAHAHSCAASANRELQCILKVSFALLTRAKCQNECIRIRFLPCRS